MSLLPDSHSSMHNPSTSSTLDSIKKFFNGGRTSKSTLRKQAHDNAKALEGTIGNLQPLLIQGHPEPIWRYPINTHGDVQNNPNMSSDYSVVYQPNITNYERTLRVSDYSHMGSGQRAVDRIGQGNKLSTIVAPGTAVNSLLVDSSFSSSSSCSNHNQNDGIKPNNFSNVPNIPSTLSTSSCSCSSSASTHGGGCHDTKTCSNNFHTEGKICKNIGEGGACSTTTTNSSSGGSSNGNVKSSSPHTSHNTNLPHVTNSCSKCVQRTYVSHINPYSPHHQLYTQDMNPSKDERIKTSINPHRDFETTCIPKSLQELSPRVPLSKQETIHPIIVQGQKCLPIHNIKPKNINACQKLDDAGRHGFGGIFNSLWKTRNHKNGKCKELDESNLCKEMITCNHCQKIGVSENGKNRCLCEQLYSQHDQFNDLRGIPLAPNMIPLRVPPLSNMHSITSDKLSIESWQIHNKNTINLKEIDDRKNWLYNRQENCSGTPKSRTEVQMRRFGTLGNNYKQKRIQDSPYKRDATKNEDLNTTFISMKQKGLTLGPSKRNQNTNRGVMPNPDDILPKEAWTDFSGNDNWPKPSPNCIDSRDDNHNGAIGLMPVKRNSSPLKYSPTNSPIYVNIELENRGVEQNSITQKFENGSDDTPLDNMHIPLSKPKPLPRIRSSIRSVGSPNLKKYDGGMTKVSSKNNESFEETSLDISVNNLNDAIVSSPKSTSQINNDKSNNTNGHHEYDKHGRSSQSSDSDSQFTAHLVTTTKDQGMMLNRKRGLPPLPKEMEQLSSEAEEVKIFRNEEMERNTKGGRNKSYNDRMKVTNRGSRNDNKHGIITETLASFNGNNESSDCLRTSHNNEVIKEIKMFRGPE